MIKIKKIFSFILKGIQFVIRKATSNKILIKRNKYIKIIKNESKNVNLNIQRNDECEISENKFFKE